MQTLLWYLAIAGLGVAFLAAFRALVEEYVLGAQLDAEAKLKEANSARQLGAEGVTMKDVRAHREAYRRALAGGLNAGTGAAKPGNGTDRTALAAPEARPR